MKNKIFSQSKQQFIIAASLSLTTAWGCHVQAAPVQKPVAAATDQTAQTMSSQQYADWGRETLAMIRRDLWLPERNLYAEKAKLGEKPRDTAFMWSVGVQLSALNSAALVEPQTYTSQLKDYTDAIEVYVNKTTVVVPGGIEGYDVLPAPKPFDLYYDDNEWIVLDLCDTYQLTGDQRFLQRAERTFNFVMSGHDDKLGGGIYWKENELSSKNTCSNAPAITSALRLYQITKNPDYLITARRLYNWTCSKLQDKDGLFWDNIKLNGEVEETKWSYNTALMIRANSLFYAVTGNQKHLDEARRIALAAKARWVQDNGAMNEPGRFAHMLLGSFLELGRLDNDPQWMETTQKVLTYVHSELRDPNGHYPDRWEKPQTTALQEFALIDQASVARAYWELAAEMKGLMHHDSMATAN